MTAALEGVPSGRNDGSASSRADSIAARAIDDAGDWLIRRVPA